MQKDDLIRIRHMLDAAGEAMTFAHDKTRTDLDKSRMLTLSIIKAIELTGEAASRVSKKNRNLHPEIPWTDIIAMRNRLIHAYFTLTLISYGTQSLTISRLL